MEEWEIEIKRLDDIRLELGLNFNQLEKLTGSSRGKIANMFKMSNEPSLGFYLTIKNALQRCVEVDGKDKVFVIPLNGSVKEIKVNPKKQLAKPKDKSK
jgi:transcriptional regulator with XRE-family HTH domain